MTAPTIDFTTYSHLIGNDEYDADMKIVEKFVQSYSEPDNILAQSSTFGYYIYQLNSYWEFTKKYVLSPEFLEDIEMSGRSISRRYTVEYIESCEKKFIEYIAHITSEFNQTLKLNIKAILRGFEFITNIICLWEYNRDILKRGEDIINRLYPLPNMTGFFGLNTYLYALFEGVYLIGIPTTITEYDGRDGCPSNFVMHDIDHSLDIGIPSLTSKIIYYSILNDPYLSQQEKECHIVNIWVEIHEFQNKNLDSMIQYNYSKLKEKFHGLYRNTYDGFADLYFSLDNITRTSENIESIDSIKPEIIQEQKLGKSYEVSYILSTWLTVRYLKNLSWIR